jgi:hypothetical protein
VVANTCTRVRTRVKPVIPLTWGHVNWLGRQMASPQASPVSYLYGTSLSPLLSSIHTACLSLWHTHSLSLISTCEKQRISSSHPKHGREGDLFLSQTLFLAKFLADMSSAYNNCGFVFRCMLCYLFADSCFDVPDFALLANLYMLFFRNWLKGKSIVVEQEYIQRVSTHMLSCRNKSILYFTI